MQTQTQNTLPAWANNYSEATQAEILALQSKANSALLRAKATESKAQNEGRDLTDDELNFTDRQMDAFADFQNQIEGFKSQGRKSKPMPTQNGADMYGNPTGNPRHFNALFGGNQDTRTPFKDIGQFARAVAVNDPRLFQNAAGMSGTVGGEGGYFVPQTFLAGLVDGSLQDEAVRPRALVVPMPSSSMTLPMFKTADRSNSFAGLEPEVKAEGDTGTNQKAQTRLMTMTAHKLMILVPTTTELMDDGGPVFTTMLEKYMKDALSQRLDEAFIVGNQSGGPLGIVSAPCTVSVAKETSQVAATVVPENLAKMIARLAPGSFKNAVWLAHSSVLASLFVMATKVKNVAGTENVGGFGPNWLSVAADGQMSLLGRPLIVSDRCEPLGTVGDIILADLTQYLVGIRQDARLAVDTSVGFKSDETYFKLTMRVDGMPLLNEPITPRRGSDTLSPFVTLATRS